MRREILDVARELLGAGGPGALTLEAVAARLEVTKPALYHYFPSKAALIFGVALDEHTALAARLNAATTAAPDGLGAVEALIRAMVEHFKGRIDVFRAITQILPLDEEARSIGPEDLAQVRPLNDLSFGPAAAKLAADMRSGRLPRRAEPRRLVFAAYLAAFGLLSMNAMVELLDDPLGYSDETLVNELCAAFRASAKEGKA
jgi:AcrR family transcriptional regulator